MLGETDWNSVAENEESMDMEFLQYAVESEIIWVSFKYKTRLTSGRWLLEKKKDEMHWLIISGVPFSC